MITGLATVDYSISRPVWDRSNSPLYFNMSGVVVQSNNLTAPVTNFLPNLLNLRTLHTEYMIHLCIQIQSHLCTKYHCFIFFLQWMCFDVLQHTTLHITVTYLFPHNNNYLFIYFAKTMLYSIKLWQNINMHGLLETAGYINTSYTDPWWTESTLLQDTIGYNGLWGSDC